MTKIRAHRFLPFLACALLATAVAGCRGGAPDAVDAAKPVATDTG
jgi:hypothetical protein